MPVTQETIDKLLRRIDELLVVISNLTAEIERLTEQHEKDAAKIEALTKRVEELSQKRVKKDSHNSSKPPSSDGYGKSNPKSLKEKSGKNQGGQNGHTGHGMKITREPDEVIQKRPAKCEGCPNAGKCEYKCAGTHYVYDVEVTTNLTAYEILAANCPLEGNRKIAGEFPAEAAAPKQYGSHLQALVGALLTAGYVSVDRTKQFLNGLGIPLSTGTVQNIMDNCVEATKAAEEYIREKVASFNVLNVDETGVRVGGNLNWMHCICTPWWSYFSIHKNRGSIAMDAIGIIPCLDDCTLIHDFWRSYLKYDQIKHAFCNAHIERELVYVFESTHQEWANQMKLLLAEMCSRRNQLCASGEKAFPVEELEKYFSRFDCYISEGLSRNPLPEKIKRKRGRQAKGKVRCLLERLRDYKTEILRFATDWSIPFTNNEAERSIRFAKVKTKVSGCFRTKAGADGFASVMSYISTARKHGLFAYEALLEALNGNALHLLGSWA